MTPYLLAACAIGAMACGSASSSINAKATASSTTGASDAGPKEEVPSEMPATEPEPAVALQPAPLKIPNAQLYEGYIVGGLPSKGNIDDALSKNIESAMSLMANTEKGISEIGPYAASRGFRYIRFTIAGKEDLNESMAWQFASTLPLLDKPGIVHSANGNRVGAIFALMAFFVDEVDAEQALAIGKAIGLGDLEAHVREQLELPPK